MEYVCSLPYFNFFLKAFSCSNDNRCDSVTITKQLKYFINPLASANG